MESHEVHIYAWFKTVTFESQTDDAWSIYHVDFSHAVIEDCCKVKTINLRRLICLHTDVQGFEPQLSTIFWLQTQPNLFSYMYNTFALVVINEWVIGVVTYDREEQWWMQTIA